MEDKYKEWENFMYGQNYNFLGVIQAGSIAVIQQVTP